MIYSAKHNVVVIEATTPLDIFGETRLDETRVAVPAILENLQNLARLDVPVPSPMELNGYDWPIKRPWVPMAHQKITSAFLSLHPRAFCLNDMGTMKTLSTLWAADFLMEMHRRKGETFRAIVVAPLSILQGVWASAIFDHFMGRRKCVILHGTPEKRIKLLEKDVDFYLINHDGASNSYPATRARELTGLSKALSLRSDIKLAIIDEAGAYRTHTTRRSRAARGLFATRPYFWLLTGTPTPNGPLDAYGLAKLLNNAKGETFNNYRQRTMMHVGLWKWVARLGAAEAASKLLSPAVRYSSDFLNLPPCTPEAREVALSPEQAKAYHELKRDAVLAMKSGALVHAVNEASLRTKLIQIVCGEVYDTEHGSHWLNPAPRLAEVEAVIEETDRKIVIFSGLTNVLNMLMLKLSKWERAIVNGHVSLADRHRIFTRFGNPRDPLRVILADPASVAHGVNSLVTASVVIWYGPCDKTEHYLQGNKRIDRPGQTGPTKIVQLISTPIEREIYQRLENNETLQGVILKLAEEK